MSVNNAIVPYDRFELEAPPPLAPLTHTIINPQNIAAEARRKNARKLSRRELAKTKKTLRKMERLLKQANYQELAAIRASLRPQMEDLHNRYLAIKADIQANPTPALEEQYAALMIEITPARSRWQAINRQCQALEPVVSQYKQAKAMIEDHRLGIDREKEETRLLKGMREEAEIYERIIISKFNALGFCYRYSVGDSMRVDSVKFAECGITLDAIYYKISAAYQTAFKNWKTDLPQGVYIVDQLLNPRTLDELSIACQRQITGTHSPFGAWLIVHRLDSVDGLVNYVSYTEVMERYPEQIHHKMPICVGVGSNRSVQWVNLSEFPHWLIGGFTFSGKSNLVNVGICTLISQQSPEDLRLVLIDLKGGLEFDYYRDVPHLHGQIVDSVSGVADRLAELESIMNERFRAFRGVAKTLEEYHIRRPKESMPRILCAFDEVASIMEHGELTKRILASLRELTRKGRAVGIHIWLCTQRPDVRAIEGSIKANLALRISGRMTTSADSVTILGTSAAKELASIPGRMVLQIGPDPQPIQAPHITNDDLEAAIKTAQQFPAPPPLNVPGDKRVIHQEWTPEMIVELSIKHLGGNVTWKAVYESAEDISQSQARALVEKIWSKEIHECNGQQYRLERGKGHMKRLVLIETPEPV